MSKRPELRVLQRFCQSSSGRIGLSITALLVVLVLLAPLVNPYNPATDRNYAARLSAPSLEHWLGTDGLGRDVLTLVWYGLQTSLGIAIASVGLSLVMGVALGLIAGYWRGWLEMAIGWLTDVFLAFPSILLAIAIVTVTGPSLVSVSVAVGVVQVPKFIRLTRGVVLSLREQGFVEAARALGASPGRIVIYHLLPACLSPVLVQATLVMGTATLEAAGLGFLGLGAQPPTPELGTMLADAFRGGYSLTSPWTVLFPGLAITLTVLAFNLCGDGLRDALDPREDH